jgi:hypothetical protein
MQNVMSAFPPRADMCGATRDVRFGPKADMPAAAALHPPLRRRFQQFLKFLLVELRVGRGEMATGLIASKD